MVGLASRTSIPLFCMFEMKKRPVEDEERSRSNKRIRQHGAFFKKLVDIRGIHVGIDAELRPALFSTS